MRPAAAGGRGRRGAITAAVGKRKDQRSPQRFPGTARWKLRASGDEVLSVPRTGRIARPLPPHPSSGSREIAGCHLPLQGKALGRASWLPLEGKLSSAARLMRRKKHRATPHPPLARSPFRVASTACSPLWLQMCRRHICFTRRAPQGEGSFSLSPSLPSSKN